MLGFVALPALAKEFTGNVDNDWHTAGNWDPEEIPDSSDDVVIPSGKLCIISTDTADAGTIDVAGTLRISDRLSLHSSTANSVSGEIDLRDDLYLAASGTDYTFNGSGKISALVASGSIFALDKNQKFTVTANVTIEGAVWIYQLTLVNDGTITTNDASDTLSIGSTGSGTVRVSGTGKFESSAGTLVFVHGGTLWNGPFDGEVNVSGSGTIKFEYANRGTTVLGTISVSGGTLINNSNFVGVGTFNLSGGTLDVNDHFTFKGAFNYTGGTIDVRANNIVLCKKQ